MSKPKALRPGGTRRAISPDTIERADTKTPNTPCVSPRRSHGSRRWASTGIRPTESNRIEPPRDQRGVAHAPGDGVSGERSQDGGVKPMPSEPKGMDARRERPATGCGQSRSVPPHKRPKPEPTPGRRRRRKSQRVGNPERGHHRMRARSRFRESASSGSIAKAATRASGSARLGCFSKAVRTAASASSGRPA